MTNVHLTRRGRLLLQTFPLFLLLSVAAQAVVHRSGPPPARASLSGPEGTSSPSASPPVTRPPATPSRTATPRPRATAKPALTGTGRLAVVPGQSAVHGTGGLRRFTVEVEVGLPDDPAAFAAAVEAVLFDARGWSGGGRVAFQRVSSGPVSFRVTLASPATTNRLCAPLDTGGLYSCHNAGRSVLNAMRWRDGAAAYPHDLAAYRTYVINHEVGHALGHGHRYRCGAGGLAPAMMQQTKSLYGCRPNPWPLRAER
ncbi:MAG: hypothetical protein QOE45_1463 [Frankiaceae bacterium]|nr:hypothetical protein [Frankiaceae bacterium]